MASILKWVQNGVKKVEDAAQGVERQLNPFDGGATYNNPAPRSITPPQVRQVAQVINNRTGFNAPQQFRPPTMPMGAPIQAPPVRSPQMPLSNNTQATPYQGFVQGVSHIPVIGPTVTAPLNIINDAVAESRKNDNPLQFAGAFAKTGYNNSLLPVGPTLFGGVANEVTQRLGINNGNTRGGTGFIGDNPSISNQVRDQGVAATLLNNAMSIVGAASAEVPGRAIDRAPSLSPAVQGVVDKYKAAASVDQPGRIGLGQEITQPRKLGGQYDATNLSARPEVNPADPIAISKQLIDVNTELQSPIVRKYQSDLAGFHGTPGEAALRQTDLGKRLDSLNEYKNYLSELLDAHNIDTSKTVTAPRQPVIPTMAEPQPTILDRLRQVIDPSGWRDERGGVPLDPIGAAKGENLPPMKSVGEIMKVGGKPPITPTDRGAISPSGDGPMFPGIPDMNTAGLGPDQRPLKLSRRIAADPRASESLKASANANGIYDQIHNKDTLSAAQSRIGANEEAAFQYAKRTRNSTEANATGGLLLNKYLNEGKFDRADELLQAIAPHAKTQGQQVQIWAAFSRLTPGGAVKYAKNVLDRAAEHTAKGTKLEGEISKTSQALKSAHKDATEEVAKEFSAKQLLSPEERLAKRINVGKTKKPGTDPITDMVNTLTKVAKQTLPEKTKSIPRDPMEFIGQAVRDKGEFKRVYDAAKDIVKNKYKDNPAALAELDQYFNEQMGRPYAKSQLNKGVQNGLKGVDLGKIVRQHFSVVDATKENLVSRLMSQAGVTKEEAGILANDITKRFNEVASKRKESVLNQMFKDHPTPEQKSRVQRVIELSNLGGFEKDHLRPLISEKLGIKQLTPEMTKKITQMAEHIQTLEQGSMERNRAAADMMQYIESLKPQSKIGNVVSVWKAGLVSGVQTHLGNVESNLSFGALKTAADIPSTVADKGISLITGRREKTTTLRGLGSGTKEGIGKAVDTTRTGFDERDITGTDKYDTHAEIDFGSSNVWQKVAQNVFGKPSNLVFRVLKAGDQPFSYPALKNSLYDQAKADGLNKGLRGKDLVDHMDRFVKNPPERAATIAAEESRKSTLAHDTIAGRFVPAIKRGIDSSDAPAVVKAMAKASIDGIVPFTKIAAGYISRTIDFTPLGVPREVFMQIAKRQFSQRDLAQAIGEATTGTGVMGIGYYLSKNGLLSGEYPKNDQKEQSRWKTEQIKPNSVRIDGHWISLNYLGPVGLLFNMGAKFQQAEAGGSGVGGSSAAAIAGLGQGLMGQSFLQGFSQFSNAVNNPVQNASNYIHSEAASAVPNWLNNIAQATDSFQRQANSSGDAIRNKIPWLREHQMIAKDAFGNELKQAAGNINAAINPFKPSNSVSTPLTDELDRLKGTGGDNFVFPVPQKALTVGKDSVKLDPKQRDAYNTQLGQAIQGAWTNMIKTPDYQALDDTRKANALRAISSDLQAVAKQKYLSDSGHGDLAAQMKPTARQQDLIANNTIDNGLYAAFAAGDKANPQDKYRLALARYNADRKANRLTPLQDFQAQQTLGRQSITSKYSADVNALYGMSKAARNAAVSANPAVAALIPQVEQLSGELAGNKFTATNKLASSSGSGGSRSRKKGTFQIPKTSSLVSSNSALNKLLSGTTSKITAKKVSVKRPTIKKQKPVQTRKIVA